MNDFNDVERELQAAFTQRPAVLSRPSLRDVKRRARRHQRQRSAGVLGACALVGVGGVAVLAQRSPANETALGGEAGPTIPASCFPTTIVEETAVVYETSTVPVTTAAPTETTTPYTPDGTYIVQIGDYPQGIAERLHIPLEALNAVNATTPGYEAFAVGLEIAIPGSPGLTTTTTTNLPGEISDDSIQTIYVLQPGDFPGSVAAAFGASVAELDAANADTPGYEAFEPGIAIVIPFSDVSPTTTQFFDTACEYPALPGDGYKFRCAGEPLVGGDGWSYFDYCEPATSGETFEGATVVPTTSLSAMTGTAIQVVNCSNQEGAAGFLATSLASEGFTVVDSDTGTIDLTITKVIYNPDDPVAFAVARAVAALLADAVVEPSGPVVPTLTLGTWAPGSNVMVLLGADLAGQTVAQIVTQTYTGTTYPQTTVVSG